MFINVKYFYYKSVIYASVMFLLPVATSQRGGAGFLTEGAKGKKVLISYLCSRWIILEAPSQRSCAADVVFHLRQEKFFGFGKNFPVPGQNPRGLLNKLEQFIRVMMRSLRKAVGVPAFIYIFFTAKMFKYRFQVEGRLGMATQSPVAVERSIKRAGAALAVNMSRLFITFFRFLIGKSSGYDLVFVHVHAP